MTFSTVRCGLHNIKWRYIFEKISHKPGLYDGLPSNHVPIYPIKRECQYVHKVKGDQDIIRKFQRTQLPITPAFAFTEFKCQGATLNKAIIDLNGGHNGAGVYVMLSRVQRLKDMMILRSFNQSKLNLTVDSHLQAELMRLEKCAEATEPYIYDLMK